MVDNIEVPIHSSIRIASEEAGLVVRFDPYLVEGCPNDADVVFITHGHYDHFSPEDLAKVVKDDTDYVMPASMAEEAKQLDAGQGRVHLVEAGGEYDVRGIAFSVVPAYNVSKDFHPAENGWVGYVAVIDGQRIYVAGDSDRPAQEGEIVCDVALVPIGGTYTYDAHEAARFVNDLRPAVTIPTHYGSVVGDAQDWRAFAAGLDEGIECVLKI